jgi:tetratricopeptide (TPR) repeat protein
MKKIAIILFLCFMFSLSSLKSLASREEWYSLNETCYKLINENKNQEAVELAKKILEQSINEFGEESLNTSTSLNVLSQAYDANNQQPQSIETYLKMVNLEKKLFGERHPHYIHVLRILGIKYIQAKNYELALNAFQTSLSLAQNNNEKLLYDFEVTLEDVREQDPKVINKLQKLIKAEQTKQ